MRIISGSARGRRLHVPRTDATRPILDRQKEALFNILREALPCRTVLDLFAGSGGLGLEALSRGAERAVFHERGREALRALERNVSELGFSERARVRRGDLFRAAFDSVEGPVDLLFLDPPFPIVTGRPERIRGLLEKLREEVPLGPEARLVLRVPSTTPSEEVVRAWTLDDARAMGESRVLLLRPRTDAAAPD